MKADTLTGSRACEKRSELYETIKPKLEMCPRPNVPKESNYGVTFNDKPGTRLTFNLLTFKHPEDQYTFYFTKSPGKDTIEAVNRVNGIMECSCNKYLILRAIKKR